MWYSSLVILSSLSIPITSNKVTSKNLAILINDSILGVMIPSQYLDIVVGVTSKYLASSFLFFLLLINKLLNNLFQKILRFFC